MTKNYRTKSYSVTATLQGDLWMGGIAYKDIDFSTATRQVS